MFSRHFISSLLVLVYGLTAGIGPFWHSPSGGCGCCLSTRSAAEPTIKSSEKAAVCDKGCAFCAKRVAATAGEEAVSGDESSLNFEKFGEDADHDSNNCVICDFYGKTYFSALGFEILDRSQIVTSVSNFEDDAPSSIEPHAAARDPPIQ